MTSSGQVLGVMPVIERHRFDTGQLERFMQEKVQGFKGPLLVEQFRTGQSNPTYRLTADSGQYVLRRKPPGKLLPSAHAVDREYRVITALRDSGVPVPNTHALCDDADVIGTPFYIMDYISGRILWDYWLPEIPAPDRRDYFDELNRVMAALHHVDYAAVGLEDYGRVGNYVERQVSRWTRQYRASETEPLEEMERLIDWLPRNVPRGDESSIVHGDYRSANVIFHPTKPRILAVLDWELSTIGHPIADFAYHAMRYRMPVEITGLVGLDLVAMGIPSEDEYVASYCRRTGRDQIRDWDYYVVFNLFRLAAINQGIIARALSGTASSEQAMETGKKAQIVAKLGWAEAQKIVA